MPEPKQPLATNATEVPRAKRWKAVHGVVIALGLVVLAVPCAPFIGIAVDVYRSHRQQQHLLHEVDHPALLAASRALMQASAGQDIADPGHDPRVPEIIRELRPSYLSISAQQLRVELHGGFAHYGFIAYADGVDAGDGWGKLIDGLFYYTD